MFIHVTRAYCTTLSVCVTLQQEKAVAAVQTKKPNIKKTATDLSRKLQKNLKKKDNNDDRMVGKTYSSVTTASYY